MASKSSIPDLLIKHGFIKSGVKNLYKLDKRTQSYVIADPTKHKKSSGHADQEEAEEVNIAAGNSFQKTNYPQPHYRYRLVYESFNMSMEEMYYWFLQHFRQDQGYPRVDKIIDIFSASENSAFFGQSAQRLSIQEDRASNFLRTIAQLVKELFQIIRELRIIDERLVPYEDFEKEVNGRKVHSKSADVTLKGVFADFAENKGGQMQPGSLYHLAQTVGYNALPDLFFNTHIYNKDDVDKVIDAMDSFNPNVRNVLKRKLYQYLVWKEKTHHELTSRRKFMIRYLRQHWSTIKMYMSWTKPYLRHIRRLSMNEDQMDSPDLIGAFETSMTEIEILAAKPVGGGYHSCILATFTFNTRPMMQYRQDYNQGPVHVGRATVTLRSYGWTDQDIDNYKRMRADEDLQLLGMVDESIQAAMEELGDDLETYLNDVSMGVFDEDVHNRYSDDGKSGKPVAQRSLAVGSAFEPIIALFGGFKEIFTTFIPIPSKAPKAKGIDSSKKKDAEKGAQGAMWQAYKNYKKSHGLLSW